MADWKVKKGNYGFTEEFTIKDAKDKVVNLTGYTVTLKVWKEGESVAKFVDTCDLNANPATGKCTYLIKESDFDTAGVYLGELELTKVGEKIDVDTFTILVEVTSPPAPP